MVMGGSGPPPRATVRVRCLARCTGRIWLWLELRSGSDVRTRARLRFRFMVRHGGRQWCWSGFRGRSPGLGLGLVYSNVYGHERVTVTLSIWLRCEADCNFKLQVYGEVWVILMLPVRCQV